MKHIKNYEDYFVDEAGHELKQILSQSTPLVPEIEKAFDLGLAFNGEKTETETFNDYISNLKLDI